MLIEVIKSLKDEELIKIELSQLFQDMAIFYSQKNNIEKAKESIQKAILLNPNAENIEIQKLRDDVSARVGVLERWRHVLIGGSIVVGFLLHKFMEFS